MVRAGLTEPDEPAFELATPDEPSEPSRLSRTSRSNWNRINCICQWTVPNRTEFNQEYVYIYKYISGPPPDRGVVLKQAQGQRTSNPERGVVRIPQASRFLRNSPPVCARSNTQRNHPLPQRGEYHARVWEEGADPGYHTTRSWGGWSTLDHTPMDVHGQSNVEQSEAEQRYTLQGQASSTSHF